MYQYAFRQWLVFFYFYCIFGWIYESTLVSVKSKQLTNRGFMKGPWIPLYGSGAIIVLFSTLPFQRWPVAVFFVGMISATILEYVTGVMMMKLFKVRYWDYSYMKFQFQGHICLTASLIWGGFSLLMVYLVHPPVEKFIFMIPGELVSILTFVITVLFVFDFTNAFRDAMDLRAILIQMESLKQQLDMMLDERRREWVEHMEEKRELIDELINEKREEMDVRINEKREEIDAHVQEKRMEVEKRMEHLRGKMEKSARHLLLHNPTSDFAYLSDEAQKIKERLHRK
ncbi:MAG: hypothetical protein NC300_11615 [Bacteroidales bacterium]|nr:hypothetical protein [Clostridium sp.]MCM1204779.1 hypothetical protein [Bacteroidales bacterium]